MFRLSNAVAIGVSVFVLTKPATGEITNRSVTEAIQTYECYQKYWFGSSFAAQKGTIVPIAVRKNGDIAYVWAEGIESLVPVAREANYFMLVTVDGQAAVASAFGYNAETMRGTPEFEKKKNQVFGGKTEIVQFRVPADCTPHFAANTPVKERMLKAVESTMANELTQFNKGAGAHYPSRLQIVVANFNIDYPETLVFVKRTEEVFYVAFHDPSDPPRDSLLKQDEYPFRQEYDKQAVKMLKSKIVAHGIVRQINIGGN